MKNKNMWTLLSSLAVMSMLVVLNTSGQTLKPGRPPMYPTQPGPTQTAPTQPAPVQPGQPVQPAQPVQPMQPGQPIPDQPPVSINHAA